VLVFRRSERTRSGCAVDTPFKTIGIVGDEVFHFSISPIGFGVF
jgi:hypothetical protein